MAQEIKGPNPIIESMEKVSPIIQGGVSELVILLSFFIYEEVLVILLEQ